MMQANVRRMAFWGVLGVAGLAALLWAFSPTPVLVDLSTVARGDMQVSVTDDGKTRVHDVYVVSAPINGRLRRIELDVGDTVSAQQSVVAGIEPLDPEFLDPRSEAQAKAAIEAAKSAQQFAAEQVNQVQAEVDFALAELARIRTLRNQGIASQHEWETVQRNYKTSTAALATARAGLQMRSFELQRAEAQLMAPVDTARNAEACACLDILAPISGTVLRVINQSGGVVSAGAPLIEIGDPTDIELIVELLSMDAVKVQPGMPVRIDNWGGQNPLWGEVSRIEPFGYTKVSALGIEEQRVKVVVAITSDYDTWQRLGHGYQVDASVIVWQATDVLRIPITALFRDGAHWAAYVVMDDTVMLRRIELGQQNHRYAEVLGGLMEGDVVVTHPDDRIVPGERVAARQAL